MADLTRFRLALSVIILVGLVVFTSPDADAARIRTHFSSRAQQEHFNEPITGNKVPLRVSAGFLYNYDAGGASSWRVEPFGIEVCWSQNGSEDNHRLFDGVTFRLRIANTRTAMISPDAIKVPDDGTRQNCRSVRLEGDDRRWLWSFTRPKWAGSFTVNLDFMNDHHHEFGEGTGDGDTWRRFKPRSDTMIQGPH